MKCSVDWCESTSVLNGLCGKHYQQVRKHGKAIKTLYDKNKIIQHETYAEIEIYDKKGRLRGLTKIDLDVVDRVKDIKWGWHSGYVKNSKVGSLHNFIMDTTSKVDHINRDKFDNRKENLRLCTFQENNRNKSRHKNNTSGVTGVSWRKDSGNWKAIIFINYKNISLGSYDKKEEAIRARLTAEKEYFGDFAPQRELFKQYGVI